MAASWEGATPFAGLYLTAWRRQPMLKYFSKFQQVGVVDLQLKPTKNGEKSTSIKVLHNVHHVLHNLTLSSSSKIRIYRKNSNKKVSNFVSGNPPNKKQPETWTSLFLRMGVVQLPNSPSQAQGSLLVAPNWMVVCPRSFESMELSESNSSSAHEEFTRRENVRHLPTS